MVEERETMVTEEPKPLTPQQRRFRRRDGIPETLLITDRQWEVALLIMDGLDNHQIARKLGIAYTSVKTHVARIMAALKMNNRTQIAVWAHRHGGDE